MGKTTWRNENGEGCLFEANPDSTTNPHPAVLNFIW